VLVGARAKDFGRGAGVGVMDGSRIFEGGRTCRGWRVAFRNHHSELSVGDGERIEESDAEQRLQLLETETKVMGRSDGMDCRMTLSRFPCVRLFPQERKKNAKTSRWTAQFFYLRTSS
jgi:hypothetical protein